MNESWPEAYKRGSKDFYGREFKVTPDTLIPRPETEMIIDAVLNLAGKAYLPGVKPSASKIAENVTIMDIGTGSGCIAITLKLCLPNARVIATDISEKALKVAKENAQELGAEIDFRQSDLLERVDAVPEIIVANLPYVDKNWDWLNLEQLAAEPSLALFAEDQGLELIKKLIDEVPKQTNYLILEADPIQHETIKTYAAQKSFNLYETRGFILVFNRDSLQA